jgi:23S rRNA pseudouridine2605 synthase
VASRRGSDAIIQAGRVQVDGQPVADPARQVDPERQRVAVDGKQIALERQLLYLLNKPVGILSAARDARGGVTVIDLARRAGIAERLYPVGRLDKDSRGLVLLSNEGELAYRLTHPRYAVAKIYQVRLDRAIDEAQRRRFSLGLPLEEGLTAPCDIAPLPGAARYRIVLREGRKRQIRRMFALLERRVLDLQRTAIGPLRLGRLPEGALRPASEAETRGLQRAVGLG